MIDIHSHIVFDVDDGPKTREDTRALLEESYRQGVRTIISTSHRRKGMFETPEEKISENFQEVKKIAAEVAPDLTIHYGAEIYFTNDVLKKLEEKKPVIVCGDLNVAHKEIDLKNPKTNRKNAGFTDEERAKFTTLLESGFTDTFRYFYPEQEGIYSWWSYRFKAREKNSGWRIDYFLTSDSLKDRLKGAHIYTDIFGSDHCPVELTIEL